MLNTDNVIAETRINVHEMDRAIIRSLTDIGETGATVRELTDFMKRQQVSISPRMIVLEREGKIVRTAQKRKHFLSGAPGIVWVTPEFADPAPETLYLQWNPGHWGNEVEQRATWNKDRIGDDDIKYVRVR